MIQLHDVTLTYSLHPAVHHLSGSFASGELTAITGPNGAGKSTLLKGIMGELPLATGTLTWGGIARREVAYLPQTVAFDRTFPMTVADTVLLGGWHWSGGFGAVTEALAERARAALALVKLEGFEGRNLEALSAGQFQRVLFARLILREARVILLDEPFAAIDERTTRVLQGLIRRWREEGRTVIAVLHDLEQIREHFPQTLLLAREKIAWGDTAAVLSADNLRRARDMAERWDDRAPICAREDAHARGAA
ncbi:MAG: ABC transporter ATP-binding protein [Magnetococcales bacterium]|nr:ABC transporter ATP-binding protein [Magnetococcales bacterium]